MRHIITIPGTEVRVTLEDDKAEAIVYFDDVKLFETALLREDLINLLLVVASNPDDIYIEEVRE